MTKFEKFQPDLKNTSLENINVRVAIYSDAEEIAVIVAERDGGEASSYLSPLQKTLLEKNQSTLYVAEYHKQVIGCGKLIWADQEGAPKGYYLAGLIVSTQYRRQGVGEKLTVFRIEEAKKLTEELYYFANAKNLSSISLHAKLGFIEQERRHSIMGVTFEGGEGILFKKSFAKRFLSIKPQS